ncbi:MAG: fibronectin type III-like domain-contianing protein, partial [Clostridia bacterium]|nr:fibronectin type III-like domain-contianing protein [Clostridia bacterium]
PSGRGYGYCDNDGRPLFPFGFGLSYTTFAVSDAALSLKKDGAEVSFRLTNTGGCDGAEVAQLYLGSHDCAVVRPVKELKAYARVALRAGETKQVTLQLEKDAFCYYDESMRYGLHDGEHTLLLGTSSEDICARFELTVQNGLFSI